MQIRTILIRIQKHCGFDYGHRAVHRSVARTGARGRHLPACAESSALLGVWASGPQYDRLPPRQFEFVPLWGIAVFFLYMMRRFDCATCGVRVEQVPWADGKHQLTTTYQWFLARWSKRLSWREVAQVFDTSWDQVFRAVALAVAWGRAQVDLRGIAAIGIDEIQWQRGHRYLTLVYQIDVGRKRLLWIGQHRRARPCRDSSAGSGPSARRRSTSSLTCGNR